MSPQFIYRPRRGNTAYPPIDVARGEANTARQREGLERWQALFPDASEDSRVDFEDFWESATQLFAALDVYGAGAVFVAEAESLASLRPAEPGVGYDPARPTALIGNSLKPFDTLAAEVDRLVLPDHRSSVLANRYYASETVQTHLGRLLRVASFGTPDMPTETPTYRDVLVECHAAGHRDLFLKVCRPKYAPTQVSLPEALDRCALDRLIPDAIAWAAVHLEGETEGVMIQAAVPMRHEYRIVVVAGVAACGAGCIEALTPLDNGGARFDPKTAAIRGQSPVQSTPELVSRYEDFAQSFIGRLRAEWPELAHYTLDLALVDGEIVVVELNPLENFGLYAMDVVGLLTAYGTL